MLRHPTLNRGNIYLSGGMQFAKDLGAGWRELCSAKLRDMKYFPLDITHLDRAYAKEFGELLYQKTDISRAVDVANELQAKSNIRKHFVKADLDLIDRDSDALIVLYDEAARRGAGTISECQHAYTKGIPVFLVSYFEDWKTVPGWLQALATRSFHNFEDLYHYLEELPHGILIKDRYGNHHTGDQYLCSLCGTAFVKHGHQFVSKVMPLYCSPCVDLVATTYEQLHDRYDFFMSRLEQESLDAFALLQTQPKL